MLRHQLLGALRLQPRAARAHVFYGRRRHRGAWLHARHSAAIQADLPVPPARIRLANFVSRLGGFSRCALLGRGTVASQPTTFAQRHVRISDHLGTDRGLFIGGAYAAVAVVSLKPARLHSFNLMPFVRAASSVLSAASDDDRVSLADDLLRDNRNLERLIRYALAFREAGMHGAMVEFDRLRAAGEPARITGRPPISAFYLFAHRRQLGKASAAGTSLGTFWQTKNFARCLSGNAPGSPLRP